MFKVDAKSGTIWIYDEIGPAYWGLIGAEQVTNAIDEIGEKPLTVRLNTPGGSVDEGIAIYNALRNHKAGVTTIADSMAASMGSYILQAGDRRIVASNAMVMVHDPWTFAAGNSAELRKSADVLDAYAKRMIPDYAKRSGKTESEIVKIMADESWYPGKDAVDAGFADEVDGDSDTEMRLGMQLMRCAKNPPKAVLERLERLKMSQKHPARMAARSALKGINAILGDIQ
jgi:ATP-dependent Clp endopeptidase proteolytic subunit ClpP